jgi:hypothetical protein
MPNSIGKRLAEHSDADTEEPAARPPKRGGGVRHRLASEDQSRASGDRSSCPSGLPLTNSLKRDWAKGELNSRQVQEYAHGAHKQGACGADRLAKAGTFGKHASNIHRDLLAFFGHPTGAPEVDWFYITTANGKRTAHPFLLPHKFFSSLFVGRPALFREYISGPNGAATTFWENMASTKFVQNHPRLRQNNRHLTIPLGFHGDAGAFTDRSSLLVLSWNSLLASRTSSVRGRRFVFTYILKEQYSKQTLAEIMRIFSWSMNVLLEGLTPSQDWLLRPLHGGGSTLAAGWRACLCHLRGDWAWYCEVFDHPKWNENERMCWLCLASSIIFGLLFTNCTDRAGWRATHLTHESWLELLRAEGNELPTSFADVVGLRLECCLRDGSGDGLSSAGEYFLGGHHKEKRWREDQKEEDAPQRLNTVNRTPGLD